MARRRLEGVAKVQWRRLAAAVRSYWHRSQTFPSPSRNRGTAREKVRYIEPYAGCSCGRDNVDAIGALPLVPIRQSDASGLDDAEVQALCSS